MVGAMAPPAVTPVVVPSNPGGQVSVGRVHLLLIRCGFAWILITFVHLCVVRLRLARHGLRTTRGDAQGTERQHQNNGQVLQRLLKIHNVVHRSTRMADWVRAQKR